MGWDTWVKSEQAQKAPQQEVDDPDSHVISSHTAASQVAHIIASW